MGFIEDLVATVTETVKKILPALKEIPNIPLGKLEAIAIIIESVAKIAQIISDTMNADTLGDKAIQAESAGIVPENYDEYEEYIEAIENFELDPEKSQRISEAEKLAKGLSVIIEGIEIKEGTALGSFLKTIYINPDFFKTERVTEYLKIFGDIGESLEVAAKYFDGNLTGSERESIEEKLVEAEKNISGNIDKSESDIENMLRNEISKTDSH